MTNLRHVQHLAFTLTALLFLACGSGNNNLKTQSAPTTESKPAYDQTALAAVPRIDAAEAESLLKKDQAVIIDARPPDPYDISHIKGAISVPRFALTAAASQLPKDKKVIAYCSSENEEISAEAVLTLNVKGISNAAVLRGGLRAWKEAKLPVEPPEK